MNDAGPVDASRLGPVRFELDTDRIDSGMVFAVGEQRFRVISQPVPSGSSRYLANVVPIEGPAAGRLLTVELNARRGSG